MYCTAITQINIFEYDLSPVSLHSWETWKLSQKQNSLGPNPSWPWSWKFNLRLWWSIPQGKPPKADTVQLVKIEPMMRQNHNWSNFRAEILDVQVSTLRFPPHLFFRWKIAFLWNIAKSFGGSTYTVTHQVWFYWKNTTMILISSPFPKSVPCQLCVSSSHLYDIDRVVLSVLYRIMLGLLWKYFLHGYIL